MKKYQKLMHFSNTNNFVSNTTLKKLLTNMLFFLIEILKFESQFNFEAIELFHMLS
jgi:hypothetical protein